MMTCETCGWSIPDNAVVCPHCGTPTQASRSMPPQSGYTPPQPGYMPQQQGYMPPQQGYMPPPQPGYVPPQQQGYMPPQQQGYMPPPQPGYVPPQQQGYMQQQYAPPMYQQGVNVTVVNNTTKSNTPVLVEVLLNVFLGIYGVGWLMAGESTTGIVLLICSFVLYWPILIALAVFTLGLGLFCDFPIAIAAIIINAVLLNNALKRKATQITMVQTR